MGHMFTTQQNESLIRITCNILILKTLTVKAYFSRQLNQTFKFVNFVNVARIEITLVYLFKSIRIKYASNLQCMARSPIIDTKLLCKAKSCPLSIVKSRL